VGPGALRIAYAHRNSHLHSYSHIYAYSYGDSHLYAYPDGHSHFHADPNSDCYSGNPDSDANMHTERDLVRHFERFWYTGG
jgi:hypothetical protein